MAVFKLIFSSLSVYKSSLLHTPVAHNRRLNSRQNSLPLINDVANCRSSELRSRLRTTAEDDGQSCTDEASGTAADPANHEGSATGGSTNHGSASGVEVQPCDGATSLPKEGRANDDLCDVTVLNGNNAGGGSPDDMRITENPLEV